MTWVRYDDLFPLHRKVAPLSDATYRLHTEAIFWCSRNTTDGVIRTAELRHVSKRGTPKRAAELVAQDLWHHAGQLCPACKERLSANGRTEPTDGWVVHDYLDFQPSAQKVATEKAAKAERQQRWKAAKKGANGDASPRRLGDASPPPSRDASEDAAPRARAGGRDTPSRPAPKEAGRGTAPASPGERRHPDPDNPDWRTLPAYGTPRHPEDAQRTHRGAAAARAALTRTEDR